MREYLTAIKIVGCVGIIVLSFSCRPSTTKNPETIGSPSTSISPKVGGNSFIIAESFYYVDEGFGANEVFVKWSALIENPNTDLYGLFPTITVTARDENGIVLGTEDQVLQELPPSGKIAWGGQLTATKVPTTVQFTATKVEWRPTKTKPSDYAPFSVEKIALTHSGKSIYKVTGDVINPYGEEVDLAITALLRDKDGKLVGGHTTFVEAVPAKGSRPFSIDYISAQGSATRADVTAFPWGNKRWNQLITP